MIVTAPGTTTQVDTTAAAAASKTGSKNAVDYQSFLKLLVAQMKNQDPTAPMESTDYIAQLATFSQVEQSIQSNTKLDSILQASALAQAGSVIGKHVTSADGTTAGVVTEVRLTSTAVIAKLANGGEVTMGAGVVIKPAA